MPSIARRRAMPIALIVILSVLFGTASAQAYTRTWTYSGSFKASLSTTSFNNTAAGEIKITVDASNCTSGYDTVYMTLLKQNSLAVFTAYGTRKSITCSGGVFTYKYPAAPKGTYRMFFERSGPTTIDENWKGVTGTVYYW